MKQKMSILFLSMFFLLPILVIKINAQEENSIDEFIIVNQNYPERNFSNNPLIIASSSTTSCTDTIISYFKKDVSTYKNQSIETALLQLESISIGGIHSNTRIALYAVDDDSWSRETMTWNNRPEMGRFLTGTTLENVTEISFTGEAFNRYLETEAEKDGVASFMMRIDQGCDEMATKGLYHGLATDQVEGWIPPILTITTSTNSNGDSSSGTGGGACAAPLFAPFLLLGMVHWRKKES